MTQTQHTAQRTQTLSSGSMPPCALASRPNTSTGMCLMTSSFTAHTSDEGMRYFFVFRSKLEGGAHTPPPGPFTAVSRFARTAP